MLVAALLLGLLGDWLLRAAVPGLNVFLWVSCLLGAFWWVTRRYRVPLAGEGRWLLLLIPLLAVGFLWRDSAVLQALDAIALLLLFALSALTTRAGQLRTAEITQYLFGSFYSGLQTLFSPFSLLLRDIEWKSLPRGRWGKTVGAVLAGILIALPLLLVFGVLFISADPLFERLVNNLFRFTPDTLVAHVVMTAFFAWLAAGFFRTALVGPDKALPTLNRPTALALGITESSVVLGLLNLLFLAFVLVQFRYLFGGTAAVLADNGLTYADYARRGFFELVAVAALVLPVLLTGHWLIAKENPGNERLFRWLSLSLIALLAVIMASAFQRMYLYLEAYGLTELRFYSTVFMGWLAVLFAWFTLTVLRGARNRFAFGVLVSGLAVLFVLHAVNPDGLIARTNIARLADGRQLDQSYIASLSADAVPVLANALPQMPGLEDRRESLERLDWRSWNWGRRQALAALKR